MLTFDCVRHLRNSLLLTMLVVIIVAVSSLYHLLKISMYCDPLLQQ